jgi:hypothetical protein
LTKKLQAFTYLDGNASVLVRSQLIDGLVNEVGLSPKTAVSYISRWRKENGVQRKYTHHVKGEPDGN